jgi:signal transduction histidine kinase
MSNLTLSSAPKPPSLIRRVVRSFLLGFILFLLGATLQSVLNEHSFSGLRLYLDDLLLGALAGLVVFVYEQRRHREMREKIAMIAAMNHHVRNALQAISYSPYTEQAKQIQLIQQSVNRIQWALREILPGSVELTQILPGEDVLEASGPDTPKTNGPI